MSHGASQLGKGGCCRIEENICVTMAGILFDEGSG